MAEFPANILLSVVTTKVDQAISRLEGSFDRLAQKAEGVSSGVANTSGFKKAKAEVNKLAKSLERFGSIGAAAGVVGIAETVNTLARELQDAVFHVERFGQSWDIANGPLQTIGNLLRGLTAPVDSLTTAFTQLGATGQATAAGIALATTGLLAFGPQVEQVAKGIFGLGKDARKTFDAVTGLNESFNMTATAVKALEQSISAAGLKKAISEATNEQQNLVASSDDFRKKTIEVLDLEEQLTAELREQQRIIGQIKSERLGAALKRTGLDKAVADSGQKLLPAFQERGLTALTTGYAEALRLTQQRTAALKTSANVEKAITEETTRGVRFREKSAEAAERLRDYNGKILTTTQGVNQAMSRSAQVSNSWQTALAQGSRWLKLSEAESDKLLESNRQTLSVYNAQIEAQKQLAALEKRRIEAQKQQQKLADANAKRLESVALGVGFPLLFGAGPGSVLGSLAGSFAGQGFGGQIFGGAIGQIVDDVVASVAKLGQALNPLTGDIDAVTQAAGLSGTSLEAYIKSLEDSGDAAGAAAEAQRVLATLIGDDGVTALEDFGVATQRLGNAFDRAMTVMAAGVARLITSLPGFLQFTKNLEDTALLDRALLSKDPAQVENLRRLEASRVGSGGVDIEKQQRAIQALVRTQRTLEAGGSSQEDLALLDKKLDIEKQRLAVAKLGGDITSNAVFEAEKDLILKEQALKIQEVNNKKLTHAARNKEFELIYTERLNKEAELIAKRQQALDRSSTRSAAERTRELEQSLKAGERLGNQLEVQLSKLGGATQLSQDLEEIKVKTAQTQERINELLNAEQQNILTTMNLERERLLIKQAQAKAALGVMNDRERDLKPLEDIQNERKALELRAMYGKTEAELRLRARDLAKDNKELTEETTLEELRKNEVVRRGVELQEYQRQVLEQTIAGVGQQMAGLFETLITGTDDWNRTLTNALTSLSSLLFKAGLSALGGGDGQGFFSILSGDFGKRANGGPVSANRPYLVGEEGPEMFVPGKSGTIVPNGGGGGVNSVVNVTINGDGTSNVDSSQGAELGRLINSSVTAILMRERRPGGMLAR